MQYSTRVGKLDISNYNTDFNNYVNSNLTKVANDLQLLGLPVVVASELLQLEGKSPTKQPSRAPVVPPTMAPITEAPTAGPTTEPTMKRPTSAPSAEPSASVAVAAPVTKPP